MDEGLRRQYRKVAQVPIREIKRMRDADYKRGWRDGLNEIAHMLESEGDASGGHSSEMCYWAAGLALDLRRGAAKPRRQPKEKG